jgi:hypothetical protein
LIAGAAKGSTRPSPSLSKATTSTVPDDNTAPSFRMIDCTVTSGLLVPLHVAASKNIDFLSELAP